jgi:hypothetical protein
MLSREYAPTHIPTDEASDVIERTAFDVGFLDNLQLVQVAGQFAFQPVPQEVFEVAEQYFFHFSPCRAYRRN